MRGIESLRARVSAVERSLPTPEPWPPVDSFGSIVFDRLQASGVTLPEETPSRDCVTFLLEELAPLVWVDEHENYSEVSICL